MIEINGNFNTALCFSDSVEGSAYEQIKSVCDIEDFAASRIRIMPDVHAGVGCTIGTTMTIVDKVVPNMVGVDIGCGMYTVELGKTDIDLEAFDSAVHTIPCGKSVWEGRKERFDLQALRCFRALKDSKRLERSIGTLGGGNHFIEIDIDDEGNKYLVIHSGSRNLGTQVAEHYQGIAIDLAMGMHWGVEPIRIGTGILGYFSRLVLDLYPTSLRTSPTKLSQKSLVRMCFAVLGEQIVVRSRKRLTAI